MKKIMIAAGAATLLIAAQTAVSASYNPLDRVTPPADRDAADSSAEVTSAKRFVGRDSRFQPASSDLLAYEPALSPRRVLLSDEITVTPRAAEPRVEDRVTGTPGPYNLALSAYSQEQTCDKPWFKGTKTKNMSSEFAFKCDFESRPPSMPSTAIPSWVPYAVLGGAIAAGVYVADDGETD